MRPLPHRITAEYTDAATKYGPDSPEARAVREKYINHPSAHAFRKFADSVDATKRKLGVSGIDYAPEGQEASWVPPANHAVANTQPDQTQSPVDQPQPQKRWSEEVFAEYDRQQAGSSLYRF